MKKLILIFLIAFSYSSCKKATVDPAVKCENAATKFSETYVALALNPSKTACNNMKSAATTFLKDCPSLTAAEKKDAQDSIDQIDCSDF